MKGLDALSSTPAFYHDKHLQAPTIPGLQPNPSMDRAQAHHLVDNWGNLPDYADVEHKPSPSRWAQPWISNSSPKLCAS